MQNAVTPQGTGGPLDDRTGAGGTTPVATGERMLPAEGSGESRSLSHSQIPLRLDLTFRPPRHPDMENVNRWLDLLSTAPADLVRDLTPVVARSNAAIAETWLCKVLQMAHIALLAGRLPVFDVPKVLHCASSPEGGDSGPWHAVVAIARIDEIPRSLYQRVVDASFRLCEQASQTTPEGDHLQAFFRRFEAEALQLLKGPSSWGKSTLPLLRAAHRRGIPFIHLGAGTYQLGLGSRAVWFDRSTTERDSAVGAKMCNSKELAAVLLRRAGLPAPDHDVVSTPKEAADSAERLGWPVVVKPADRDRGEGVTVDIADGEALTSAFRTARQASHRKRVIVERQVEGVCHRLFIAGGRLLYAVRRLPMSVVGDGRLTVADLIETAVRDDLRLPPWHRSGIRPLDNLARAAITAAGLTPEAVPEPGRRVALRRIESTEWGGVDEDVTEVVHPENLRVALAAARLFRLEITGIDIISPDITRPWYDNGAIINEVNFAPLLGGGEISRRHIGEYLERILGGDGRIPVLVFAGGPGAWQAASRYHARLCSNGQRAWLSTALRTVNPDGTDQPMTRDGLFHRTRALVMDRAVDALVLVVHDDELLHSGPALDRVDTLYVIDEQFIEYGSVPGSPLAPPRLQSLMRLLHFWASGRVQTPRVRPNSTGVAQGS